MENKIEIVYFRTLIYKKTFLYVIYLILNLN